MVPLCFSTPLSFPFQLLGSHPFLFLLFHLPTRLSSLSIFFYTSPPHQQFLPLSTTPSHSTLHHPPIYVSSLSLLFLSSHPSPASMTFDVAMPDNFQLFIHSHPSLLFHLASLFQFLHSHHLSVFFLFPAKSVKGRRKKSKI